MFSDFLDLVAGLKYSDMFRFSVVLGAVLAVLMLISRKYLLAIAAIGSTVIYAAGYFSTDIEREFFLAFLCGFSILSTVQSYMQTKELRPVVILVFAVLPAFGVLPALGRHSLGWSEQAFPSAVQWLEHAALLLAPVFFSLGVVLATDALLKSVAAKK